METFWFFWLRFRRAYDSAYDSDFWFSLGHKRSYDSAYDSDFDSVASENQPLEISYNVPSLMLSNAKTISISGAALKNNKVDVGHHQGPVVQKVNSAIHRINHYPVDNTIGFANTYPLDSDLLGG